MKLPRFTLRELFLLVALAAMGCGWWVERRQLVESLEQSEHESLRDYHVLNLDAMVLARWVEDHEDGVDVEFVDTGVIIKDADGTPHRIAYDPDDWPITKDHKPREVYAPEAGSEVVEVLHDRLAP